MTIPPFAQAPDEVGWFTTATDHFLFAYQSGMRSSLFTGFLTLCGFLMSAKTFIVVQMKKEVYDKPGYQKVHKIQSRLPERRRRWWGRSGRPEGGEAGIYSPLQALSHWLLVNVVMSLFTSVSQFTVGFIPHWAAALFCVMIALTTVGVLARSLLHIRTNLNAMFNWLKEEAKDKAREEAKEKEMADADAESQAPPGSRPRDDSPSA